MNDAITQGGLSQEWTMLDVDAVIVKARMRETDDSHVELIATSFRDLRHQIQPIVVDEDLVLVDGAHRLAGAKLAGWDQIGAMIVRGATEMDRSFLELEANRLRKQMSPAQVQAAWESFGEPLFKARAKQKQIANLRQGSETPVTRNPSNGENEMSMVQVAREMTGLSLDSLNKIADIRAAAEGEDVPEILKKSAQKALRKLEVPGSKVDPVYTGLQKLANTIRLQGDPAEARRQVLEKQLGDTMVQLAHLEERLDVKGLADELGEASRITPLGDENLRTIRMSLTKSLAMIVAVECRMTNNPETTLNLIGAEVTRLLSKRSVELLELEVSHERS